MSLWFLALRLQSNNVFCWNGTASSMVHGASMRQMSMFLKFSPKYDPHSNSIVVWRYGMMRIVGYCAAVLIILIHSAIAWFFAYVCVYMMKRTYLLIYIYIYWSVPNASEFVFGDMLRGLSTRDVSNRNDDWNLASHCFVQIQEGFLLRGNSEDWTAGLISTTKPRRLSFNAVKLCYLIKFRRCLKERYYTPPNWSPENPWLEHVFPILKWFLLWWYVSFWECIQ